MPTTDARRAALEQLRFKAGITFDRLTEALDEDHHENDCVLRCIGLECEQTHSCDVCREDGEV